MTEQELGQRIIALTGTLYRVSCGLLQSPQDREDAVQSAVEKAWRKALSLRDEQRLRPWLIKILINECYTLLRKKGREIPMQEMPESPPPADEVRQGQGLELREAVLSLPETLRMPIVLHYMEGFSIQEISSALGCPKGTVLSRMNRGRKQLKDLLMEVNEDDAK